MRILITGTPGAGKTRLAHRLGEDLGIPVFSVLEEAKRRERIASYEGDTAIISEDTVEQIASALDIEHDTFILEGHMSHYARGDLVICVVCEIGELTRRLRMRGYTEEKVRENVDAEIFRVCQVEAAEQGHEPIIVDSTRDDTRAYTRLVERLRQEGLGHDR